ncbi:MAG TPA: DUF6458 family protein [Acidimicrobiales bacterium]|nr:DUF6458 family protein [Acidimicrobiales bacterium]
MGIGLSIFLVAVGAILTFAVSATVSGVNIATVGVVLMIVGGLGLVASMIVFGGSGRTTYVDGPSVERERVIHER